MPIEKINLKSNTIEYGQLAPLRNQIPNREPTKYVTKPERRYANCLLYTSPSPRDS